MNKEYLRKLIDELGEYAVKVPIWQYPVQIEAASYEEAPNPPKDDDFYWNSAIYSDESTFSYKYHFKKQVYSASYDQEEIK